MTASRTDPPDAVPREVPGDVLVWAEQREAARTARDFGTADALRAAIDGAGWQVADTAQGWTLRPKPPYAVLQSVADLPDRSAVASDHRVTVALLVDGWPADLRTCVHALLAYTPPEVLLLGLDLGNVDGAGDALHELALAAPDRVQEWHVQAATGWAAARTAALRLDVAEIHVWLETSTLLEGDGLSPILDAFADPGVVAAGWRGVDVDLDDDWRSFHPAGPGEVDALLGYLFAMRRQAALEAGGPDPKARFYRNADMEFSFALRESTGGRLVVPAGTLPIRQGRHRGYHDSDPAYRDRESKRNYDRFLRRFRHRTDLLAPHHPPSTSYSPTPRHPAGR